MDKVTLGQRLRYYWHEVYYFFASASGVEFAMRCQEVAKHIDLAEKPATRMGRFRLALHLSLCQACQNYYDMTGALKALVRDLFRRRDDKRDLEKLNKELMEKYARQKGS